MGLFCSGQQDLSHHVVLLSCFLQCCFHLSVSVPFVNITIDTRDDLNLSSNATICCTAQQWLGFKPTLRLALPPTHDQEEMNPETRYDGDWELCLEFIVDIDHHLSTASCGARYGRGGGRGRWLTATLLLRVFSLTYQMKVKSETPVGSGSKTRRVYSCLCTVTFDDPQEVTVTWYINETPGTGGFPENHSTKFLGYVQGKRQRLPLNYYFSRLTIVDDDSDPIVTSIYCRARHALQGLLENTTTAAVPDPEVVTDQAPDTPSSTSTSSATSPESPGASTSTTVIISASVLGVSLVVGALTACWILLQRWWKRRRRQGQRGEGGPVHWRYRVDLKAPPSQQPPSPPHLLSSLGSEGSEVEGSSSVDVTSWEGSQAGTESEVSALQEDLPSEVTEGF